MAGATITTTASITGPNGVVTEQISEVQTIASPFGDVSNIPLSSGDNTITIPAGASVFMFVPPPANIIQLTAKLHSGDTGQAISPNQPFGPIFFPPGYAGGSIIINSASAISSLSTILIN